MPVLAGVERRDRGMAGRPHQLDECCRLGQLPVVGAWGNDGNFYRLRAAAAGGCRFEVNDMKRGRQEALVGCQRSAHLTASWVMIVRVEVDALIVVGNDDGQQRFDEARGSEAPA
jgi:hypothetical protein